MKFSLAQIDHFVTYITSLHIGQNLPFGERRITLSTKETVKVPNVVRMLIPERIVNIQRFVRSRNSSHWVGLHLRIFNVCSASVLTSLQGIDHVSSAWAEVWFDELREVVETLGDARQGMTWAKLQENNLHASKWLQGERFFWWLFYDVSYPVRLVLFLISLILETSKKGLGHAFHMHTGNQPLWKRAGHLFSNCLPSPSTRTQSV